MLNLPAVDLLCPQTDVRVPDFPANESKGSHVVPFTRTVFIEQSDFREVRERQKKSSEPSRSSRIFLHNFWIVERRWCTLLPVAGDGEGLQASDAGTACRSEACWVRHLCPEGHQGKTPGFSKWLTGCKTITGHLFPLFLLLAACYCFQIPEATDTWSDIKMSSSSSLINNTNFCGDSAILMPELASPCAKQVSLNIILKALPKMIVLGLKKYTTHRPDHFPLIPGW